VWAEVSYGRNDAGAYGNVKGESSYGYWFFIDVAQLDYAIAEVGAVEIDISLGRHGDENQRRDLPVMRTSAAICTVRIARVFIFRLFLLLVI
jgi:hypothetical protein